MRPARGEEYSKQVKKGLLCGHTGLSCKSIGLFCCSLALFSGNIGLFYGNVGVFADLQGAPRTRNMSEKGILEKKCTALLRENISGGKMGALLRPSECPEYQKLAKGDFAEISESFEGK